MTITYRQRVPSFPAERLEAISKVLADTTEGLTGSEIDHLLLNSNIPNPTPDMTKWQAAPQCLRGVSKRTSGRQPRHRLHQAGDGPCQLRR